MTFNSLRTDDIVDVFAGEPFGTINHIESETVFEDGIIVGRFAKLDAGSLDKLDGSATPVVGGVVVRDPTRAVESSPVLDASLVQQVDYERFGYISVDVVTGQVPVKFGQVYAVNAAGADEGKATATAGGSALVVKAEFIREIKTDVWLIRVSLLEQV